MNMNSAVTTESSNFFVAASAASTLTILAVYYVFNVSQVRSLYVVCIYLHYQLSPPVTAEVTGGRSKTRLIYFVPFGLDILYLIYACDMSDVSHVTCNMFPMANCQFSFVLCWIWYLIKILNSKRHVNLRLTVDSWQFNWAENLKGCDLNYPNKSSFYPNNVFFQILSNYKSAIILYSNQASI